jgi:hypothetical protein
MQTKDRVLAMAQDSANRTGNTVLVLNLNRIGAPLWVCRVFDARLAKEPDVIVVTPH